MKMIQSRFFHRLEEDKMSRYKRNADTITSKEQEELRVKSVCIVGCGGLGEYVAEMLCRIGIGNLSIIDYDIFEESNLNRQIFSHSDNLGRFKVGVAKERLLQINPELKIQAIHIKLDEENASGIIINHDLVIDALDSIQTRQILQENCRLSGKILVSGSIAGWYGQVTVIYPQDTTNNLFGVKQAQGIEMKSGNPAFSPALVASIQVAESIKILLNKGNILRKKILFIDLLENDFEIIELK